MKNTCLLSACLILLLLVTTSFPALAQNEVYARYMDHRWVDSVMASLSVEEQIAQLLWISPEEDQPLTSLIRTDRHIRNHPIGGLVWKDVDGDGRMLMMRVPDPNGAWKVCPEEPRLLVRR